MDRRTKELNQQLLAVCTADVIDYQLAEDLLKQGAEPLGEVINVYGDRDNLYFAAINDLIDNEETLIDLYRITELFSQYGLNISAPSVPYDDENVIHPLTVFSYATGEYALKGLMILLDNGLRAEDAAWCWEQEVSSFTDIWGKLEDLGALELYYDYIRKLMLIASYPHDLNADEELRKEIWYDYNCNGYDVMRFRNWNDYLFEVDTSHCERGPEVYKSVVTIHEKNSGKPVWKFGVCLSPDDV